MTDGTGAPGQGELWRRSDWFFAVLPSLAQGLVKAFIAEFTKQWSGASANPVKHPAQAKAGFLIEPI